MTTDDYLTHEFDSSQTCNYCGVAAERVSGIAEQKLCPARQKRERVMPATFRTPPPEKCPDAMLTSPRNYDENARRMRALFQAYIAIGFQPGEAFELVKVYLAGIIAKV